jgi:hypothetical protein
MERGLRFFGGVAVADIFDNMKTVVQSHTPQATIFNHRFLRYARARGFAVIACNVKKANEKGRVERPIGFVRTRFWPGRRFVDLVDLNTQAAVWRDDFANHRVHEDTGKVPALVFKNEEQRLLKPVPDVHFDTDDIESMTVTTTFRVSFDRNRYSVPARLVGQAVLLRATDDAVTIFLGPKPIAAHRRSWSVGEDRRAIPASRRTMETRHETRRQHHPSRREAPLAEAPGHGSARPRASRARRQGQLDRLRRAPSSLR